MALSNCKSCGGLFVQVSRNICDACFKEEEEILTVVQEYVRDHPEQDVPEVAEELEVDEALILKFIREKRLIVSSSAGDASLLACEACGTSIISGRFCSICRQKLGAGLSAPAPEPSGASSSRIGVSRRESSGASGSLISAKFQRK